MGALAPQFRQTCRGLLARLGQRLCNPQRDLWIVVGALVQSPHQASHLLAIGRIELQGRKTIVGLPREVADQVLEGFPSLQIRGKTARLSLARPRLDDEVRDKPGKPWRKKKSGKYPKKGPKRPYRNRRK